MTHTLIATNTLDACIHICAPLQAYTQFCRSVCTTQHTTYDVKGGEGGVRGRPQAPHKHPSVSGYHPPPPVPFCGLGCGATVLVVLEVREGIHYLFAGVHTCKKIMDTLPHLKHNKHSSPTNQTTKWKGGGG